MKVLIIGAAGMLGRKLAERLAADGRIGASPIGTMHLVDVVSPPVNEGRPAVETEVADLSSQGTAEKLIAARPDVIFHLAAIVSGEAEADFEKGYRINLDGTRELFEAVRRAHEADGYRPRLVFASSIAVFGAPFPERIPDSFHLTPLTSYGTQKAIGELLLADYSRRGFFDGIGLRLPTICIRPGQPNKAASGFFSNILREPINGEEAVLPVGEDVRHWFASPRAAVEFFIHAATLDLETVGPRRNLTMPGLAATVGEEIAALERMVGPEAAGRIRREPDATIAGIVAGWPRAFEAQRACELGFEAETDFDEIIRVYLEEEGGGSAV
ncbi:D-erythronate dehydrogenase [Jiella marina]|uniref:D-erythronate dehydrogenase n=1 Tax=Jiella sp. LLJ827 TaxID=2917712 RepID=UPI002100C3AF|nr:D-erythronate dehydrogenase [Jiella sp. LLJ827]MCQ0986459.1 SDR family oxidoreductase [Jiella sp. LLJ827]